MTGSKGGSPRRCAREARKTEETRAGLAPGRGSSAEETKAVVQVRVRVHVTHTGQAYSRLGIGTSCCRQRPHHRTAGECQLVPGEGPGNDEAGNVAIL